MATRMDDHGRTKRALETVLGVPTTTGNSIEILRNGDEIFPSMLHAIGAAERSIDLLTFIYWNGETGQVFANALAERALAGVRVRVLLDAAGTWQLGEHLVQRMRDAGCDVRYFRPITGREALHANNRTHRKVLICDETVSFTGGVGIADEWRGDARNEHEWRDTHFRIEGPATDGLRAAFLDNWAETGPDLLDPDVDLLPDQPRPGDVEIQVVKGMAEAGNSDVWNLFRVLIEQARHRLHISSAYFTPDDEILRLLRAAAERGVEVHVMVPGPHADKRVVQLASEADFEPLLDAGVHVHSFQTSMLHAKILTIDGYAAVVGSANFNQRSTEYDDEVVLVVYDEDVVATLDRHFEEDLEACETIDRERWSQRSRLQMVREKAVAVIDDLL